MIIDEKKIENIKNLVNKDVLNFIASNISPKYLTDIEKDFLIKQGIDIDKLTIAEETVFSLAFKFGMYSNNTDFNKAKEISLYQFKQILASNKFLPLTNREKESLDFVTYKGVTDIKNYGSNNLLSKIVQSINEINTVLQPEYEKAINDKSKLAIIKRQSAKMLASELRAKTGDLTRDWIRVSNFVLHTAFDNGLSKEIERLYGSEALVFKHVYKGSCKYCERLYLDGSKPKVFKLSELKANGTNIGKKVNDWKPVIGSTHPYCRCTLVDLPPYYKWDEQTNSFKPKIDKDANLKYIEEYQNKLRLRKLQRGENLNINELRKSLNDIIKFNKSDIIKGNMSKIQIHNTDNKESKIIKSYYKAVNEYENQFNISFFKVLSNILNGVIKYVL